MAKVTIVLEDVPEAESSGGMQVSAFVEYEPGLPLIETKKQRRTNAQRIGYAIYQQAIRLKMGKKK